MRVFLAILCVCLSLALLVMGSDAGAAIATIGNVLQTRKDARKAQENARRNQQNIRSAGALPQAPRAIRIGWVLDAENCNPRDGNVPVEMYKEMMVCDIQDILAAIPTELNGMKVPESCPHDIGAVAEKIDADHDGKLPADEQMELINEVLTKFVDQNRDGCVTKAELEDFGKKCGA